MIGDPHGLSERRVLARRHRRRQARSDRGRLIAVAIGGLIVAGGAQLAARSDLFAVARVASNRYRFTDEAVLEREFGRYLGRNLWRVRPAELHSTLVALPWIRDVRVTRRWPATLEVALVEWEPLAFIAAGSVAGRTDLVLRGDGSVVPLPEDLPPPALPVLIGVSLDVLGEQAWRLSGDSAGRILALLRAIRETGIESSTPVDFLVAHRDGYDIVLQEGRERLRVGTEDFARRLRKYLVARDRIPDGMLVDLRFEDRVAYRPARS
jgi:cell division septal protein FtsQ